MKYKSDRIIFNSNDSCMVLWGVKLNAEIIKNFTGKIGSEMLDRNITNFDISDIYDILYNTYMTYMDKDIELYWEREIYSFPIIGISPYNLGDNETLNELKQRIIDACTKIGINIQFLDIEYIEELIEN